VRGEEEIDVKAGVCDSAYEMGFKICLSVSKSIIGVTFDVRIQRLTRVYLGLQVAAAAGGFHRQKET
jgi:hypothetical protein